jgi:3-oxoacyl-ACP reductase-like protein
MRRMDEKSENGVLMKDKVVIVTGASRGSPRIQGSSTYCER